MSLGKKIVIIGILAILIQALGALLLWSHTFQKLN